MTSTVGHSYSSSYHTGRSSRDCKTHRPLFASETKAAHRPSGYGCPSFQHLWPFLVSAAGAVLRPRPMRQRPRPRPRISSPSPARGVPAPAASPSSSPATVCRFTGCGRSVSPRSCATRLSGSNACFRATTAEHTSAASSVPPLQRSCPLLRVSGSCDCARFSSRSCFRSSPLR